MVEMGGGVEMGVEGRGSHVFSFKAHLQHFEADHLKAAPLEPLYDLAHEAPLDPVWLHDNQGSFPLACDTCRHAHGSVIAKRCSGVVKVFRSDTQEETQ